MSRATSYSFAISSRTSVSTEYPVLFFFVGLMPSLPKRISATCFGEFRLKNSPVTSYISVSHDLIPASIRSPISASFVVSRMTHCISISARIGMSLDSTSKIYLLPSLCSLDSSDFIFHSYSRMSAIFPSGVPSQVYSVSRSMNSAKFPREREFVRPEAMRMS